MIWFFIMIIIFGIIGTVGDVVTSEGKIKKLEELTDLIESQNKDINERLKALEESLKK